MLYLFQAIDSARNDVVFEYFKIIVAHDMNTPHVAHHECTHRAFIESYCKSLAAHIHANMNAIFDLGTEFMSCDAVVLRFRLY